MYSIIYDASITMDMKVGLLSEWGRLFAHRDVGPCTLTFNTNIDHQYNTSCNVFKIS